jgi:hypothetical protein
LENTTDLSFTYWQDDIHKVHDSQYYDAHAHVVVSIREEKQSGREDVVCEHLRVVLALLLNVDDENLLDPETPLN